METQLFTWTNWDDLSEGVQQFYDITTTVEIEDIPKGSKFSLAILDYSQGTLTLQDSNNKQRSFDLTLRVSYEVAV